MSFHILNKNIKLGSNDSSASEAAINREICQLCILVPAINWPHEKPVLANVLRLYLIDKNFKKRNEMMSQS